jgi:radical SAM superfamily enzyme YgiQ (UPF0313 family)
VNDTRPHILLLNPWIHDFAAYDFWSSPVGLFQLGAILRDCGIRISYIDCLNRFHPNAPVSDPAGRHGRGPYIKTPLPNPVGLEHIPRQYSRYGIPEAWLHQDLAAMDAPDMIFITSMMTYWYPGIIATVRVLREVWPDTPVILGGVYANLCYTHAVELPGIDRVISGPGEHALSRLLQDFIGCAFEPAFDFQDLDAYPYPAHDLQGVIPSIPILTSRGCPYACVYCASSFLTPDYNRRSPDSVVAEIAYWHHRYGVVDFAFYDDALLIDADNHALQIFEGVIRKQLPVRFHTPNALHIREITAEAARLMRDAGFETVRLGLETAVFTHREALDRKVTEAEFRRAADNLNAAGFQRNQVGAYLLVGLPGQSTTVVKHSIDIVAAADITPILAYYTPIPHTPLWDAAVEASPYDLTADPVFTNNAIFPCRTAAFSWDALGELKKMVTRVK